MPFFGKSRPSPCKGFQNIIATLKYGNISSKRRIGYFIFRETHSFDLINTLLKSIRATKNWVLLDPYGGSKGVTDKRWRIIDNVKSQ